MTKNTLDLGGDGDEVEFIETIETAFAIKFDAHELESCRTMGDLHDATCRHVRPVETGSFPCLSATTYRRLKRAIAEERPGTRLAPDTARDADRR